MTQDILRSIESGLLKANFPAFQVGDTVRVKILIKEGTKERTQSYEGLVIAIKGGSINKTFTVRRVFQGVAIERTFLVHSPKVTDLTVMRKGKARRAKLYYMRERVGTKASRVKEDTLRIAKDFQDKLVAKEAAKVAAAEAIAA